MATLSPRVTVYGAHWCPDVKGIRRYLETIGVRYVYVDIEQDEEGARLLEKVHGGKHKIPTLNVDGEFRRVTRIWDLNVLLSAHGLLDFQAG